MPTPSDPIAGQKPPSDASAQPTTGVATPTTSPTPATPALSESPSQAATDPTKQALGWMHTARFLTTAAQLHHLPAYDLPEIAFVGRSNAGKSTCINVLTQQKRLAFASKTPGRTQHINLFALGRQGQTDTVLADLPGYGYAAVPKRVCLRKQVSSVVIESPILGLIRMFASRAISHRLRLARFLFRLISVSLLASSSNVLMIAPHDC